MKFEPKNLSSVAFHALAVQKSVCRSNVLTGVKWLPRYFRWHALTSMQNRASPLSMYWGQWCVTINNDAVAIFVSQARMQLRKVNENQNSLNFRVWRHVVRSQWVCMICQRSILGHVWPLIASWLLTSYPNLWPHVYSLWPLKVTHTLELTSDLIRTHRDLSAWCHTLD